MFELFFVHFWVLALLTNAINTGIQLLRARGLSGGDGERWREYRWLLLTMMGAQALPWLYMGVGMLTGATTSVFEYLRLGGNLVVSGWYLCWVGLVIVGDVWIYRGSGADFLANHPGIYRNLPTTARGVKVVLALYQLGGLAMYFFLWQWQKHFFS